MVGVVWDNPDTALHGSVQVRTRAATSGTWSGWQDVETHYGDDGADPGTAERTSGRVRGATAPLWVGDSDGVEVRVRAGAEERAASAGALPSGLRLELVDPGEAAAPEGPPVSGPRAGSIGTESVTASAANADLAPSAPWRSPPSTVRGPNGNSSPCGTAN